MSEVTVSNVSVPTTPVEVRVSEPFQAFYHREFTGLVRSSYGGDGRCSRMHGTRDRGAGDPPRLDGFAKDRRRVA